MGIQDMADKATYERLENDVAKVKDDIGALADQITDALNAIAGNARKQARRGYKQARANVDSVVDDVSDRGAAMIALLGCAAVILIDVLVGLSEPPANATRFVPALWLADGQIS